MGERLHKIVALWCKLWPRKQQLDLRTLYVHAVLNSVMFPQILYDIFLHARHFLPVKFFPSITFINCFELPQNVAWTDE